MPWSTQEQGELEDKDNYLLQDRDAQRLDMDQMILHIDIDYQTDEQSLYQ